ncbi:MAG: flagellar hook-basal body complex protein FliE [Gammaproteobacteria bacterium]|nr:flagellar hook-basal body complex protein FliE [Gammaproteobacteria bacterium]
MSQLEINQVLQQMRAMSAQAAPATANEINAENGFASLLKQSVDSVNQLQQTAGKKAAAFETGTGDVSLAEVMLAGQKASISFRALTEVRNKFVEAYREIMNMPI